MPSAPPRSLPVGSEPQRSPVPAATAEPASTPDPSPPLDLGPTPDPAEPEWTGVEVASFLRTHPELRALIRSDADEHFDGIAVVVQRDAAPTVCVSADATASPRCTVLPGTEPVTEIGLTGHDERAGAVVRQPLRDRDALFVLRVHDGALLGPIVVDRGETTLSSVDEGLDDAPELAVAATTPDGDLTEFLQGLLRARRLEVAPMSTWRSHDAVAGVHVIERRATTVCLSTPDWRCTATGDDLEFSTLHDYGELYEYALWEPHSQRAFMVHHVWSYTNGVHSEDTTTDRLDVFGEQPLRMLGSVPLGELIELSRDTGRMEHGAWQPRRGVVSVSWSTTVALQDRCLVLHTTAPKRRRVRKGWLVRPPKTRARVPVQLSPIAGEELLERGLLEFSSDEASLPAIYPDLSGVWTFDPTTGFSRHSTSPARPCPSP